MPAETSDPCRHGISEGERASPWELMWPVFKWIAWVWPYALIAIALIGLAHLIWAGRF